MLPEEERANIEHDLILAGREYARAHYLRGWIFADASELAHYYGPSFLAGYRSFVAEKETPEAVAKWDAS